MEASGQMRLTGRKIPGDITGNSDIFAAFFGGFWPDFPMIFGQSAL
jgi:hypothetical protein